MKKARNSSGLPTFEPLFSLERSKNENDFVKIKITI